MDENKELEKEDEHKKSVGDGVVVEDLFADEEKSEAPKVEEAKPEETPKTETTTTPQTEPAPAEAPAPQTAPAEETLVIEEPASQPATETPSEPATVTPTAPAIAGTTPQPAPASETPVAPAQPASTPAPATTEAQPATTSGDEVKVNADGTIGEKPKANKTRLIVMLLLIVVLAAVVVFYVLPMMKEETPANNNENDTEEQETTPNENTENTPTVNYDATINENADTLLLRLEVPSYVDSTNNLNNMNYYYAQDKLDVATMQNKVKLALAVKNLDLTQLNQNAEGNYVLEEATLNSSFVEVFGPNATYQYEDIAGILTKGADGNLVLTANIPTATNTDSVITKVKNSVTTETTLELYVAPAYIAEDGVVYTKVDKATPLAEGFTCPDKAACDLSNYYDKLDTYKYTFTISNGSYYFTSVELVK